MIPPADRLFLGIDIGTSGVRTAIVDADGEPVSNAAVPMEDRPLGDGVDAEAWWDAVAVCLHTQLALLDAPERIAALAIDGTSGSLVLVDDAVRPVSPGLLYDRGGFDREAERIAAHAPEGSIARGGGSALARALHLFDTTAGPARLCHQADFAVARLLGRAGASDESNALKTGYDARNRRWPDWIVQTGLPVDFLPEVHPVGAMVGHVGEEARGRFGLAAGTVIVAGATDSVAAFLAAGNVAPGTAVTSLGTTLAIKVLADRPVADLARGVYSHRVGERWLPGGASNVGGGALLEHFPRAELDAVSARIDPNWLPQHLDTYPLPRPGERFPRNEPTLAPVLPPRDDEARFLFELLHAVARIEREGYEALASLGAPYPTRVLTAGGGARNPVWTAIRQRVLGVPVEALADAEASVGMALLARTASG